MCISNILWEIWPLCDKQYIAWLGLAMLTNVTPTMEIYIDRLNLNVTAELSYISDSLTFK